MTKLRSLAFALGTLLAVLTATELAAQNRNTAPDVDAPIMGQDQGMMQQMSQMMETCTRMMQAHLAQPHHQPEQQPQSNQ